MASTFIAFQPSTVTPFVFNPTLNGVQYIATILWNVFGQRYYLQLTDLSNNPILFRSVVSSGPRLEAAFTWLDNVATATTTLPHNIPVGQVDNVRISETETGFDGNWTVLATAANTLTYALSDPEEASPLTGIVNFALNLVGGLNLGWLLYHYDSQQFEFEGT